MKLEIEEHRAGGAVGDAGHIRRVVVEYAPALFILPCGDTGCKDGGHDATQIILGALERGEARFEGEDSCSGQVGTATCGRVMRYVGIATYKA